MNKTKTVRKTAAKTSEKKSRFKSLTLKQTLPYILLIGGAIGLICSFLLTTENVNLLKHPTESLICDLNPIISCGSVMKTPQASAFGFPNSIVGLIGFTILPTVGLAMLAGATFKKWFWWLIQASNTFALAFTFWFQYQSFTNLNALCPFCMVVWAVTIPIFVYTTFYIVQEGYLPLKPQARKVVTFLQKYHIELLVAWYLAIILMILNHFWYYWQTLI